MFLRHDLRHPSGVCLSRSITAYCALKCVVRPHHPNVVVRVLNMPPVQRLGVTTGYARNMPHIRRLAGTTIGESAAKGERNVWTAMRSKTWDSLNAVTAVTVDPNISGEEGA